LNHENICRTYRQRPKNHYGKRYSLHCYTAWEQEGENGETLLDSELISSEFNRMLFNLEYHYKKDLAE